MNTIVKRTTETCTCEAYPFPHRKGGGLCEADNVCEHGYYMTSHPDFDPAIDRCFSCEEMEMVDRKFDEGRDG